MSCLVLCVALATACAHGDQLSRGLFRKGPVTVHMGEWPISWKRVAVDGADLAFRDDARAASVLIDVHCGERDDDAPLSVLTTHLIMGTTERDFQSQETAPFDGREALHTLMRAKLDGVSLRYDIYVMKKDGCVFDLVYVAGPERFAEGTRDFEGFVAAFHAESPSAVASSGQTKSLSDP
ncbi:MAG: hypothetical protein M3O50_04775 [Myxococcota bacterium]|nr:hypothetical protein [Myxococcota bacterium]